MDQVHDYNYLRSDGVLGFYNSSKIETIYAHEKTSNEIYILFSRVLLAEPELDDAEDTIRFNYKYNRDEKEYNFGIFRQTKNIDYSDSLFRSLQKDKWIDYNGLNISVEELKEIPARYIKANSIYVKTWNSNPYSDILGIKSDYKSINNGDYIIEFANLKKENWKFLFESNIHSHLTSIQDELSRCSDLKIEGFPDKIGNIIFQLPISAVKLERLEEDCKIKVEFDNRFTPKPNCVLLYEKDNVEKVSSILINEIAQNGIITFSENTYPIKVTIYDRERNVVLAESDNCEYQRPFAGVSSTITIVRDMYRTINLIGNEKKVNVIFHPPPHIELTYRDWVEFRKREENKVIAKESRRFKTYSIDHSINRNEAHLQAKEDLKFLINRFGQHGVYLVDPYIDSEDILSTLYFCKLGNVEMKIIGGSRIIDNFKGNYIKKNKLYKLFNMINKYNPLFKIPIKNLFQKWKDTQVKNLNGMSNNFGIKLEYRIAHNVHNSLLHDRFLIFPYSFKLKRARVWSIGVSVNSVGKSFHVLTEIGDGETILKKFNEIWKEMDNNEECLICKIE